MKLVLFVAAVAALVWLLRGLVGRRNVANEQGERHDAANGRAQPQAVIACAQCGLHLPRDEALPGRGGVFCCDAHRAEYERAHHSP